MDAAQIQELLDAAKPKVIQSLQEELTRSITYDVRSRAATEVSDHVTAWVKENIIPEVTAALIESKEGLISLGVQIAPKLVDVLTASFIEGVSEKLKNSWERRKIFESMVN